jgi:hypothetical protein
MPLSSIELCSSALVKLGANGISSFEDGTAEARVAASLYPILRDALLCAHPWSFATAKTRLARLSVEPVADHLHAFQLPQNFLKALSAGSEVRARGLSYQIVNRQLHTDATEVVLTYPPPERGRFPRVLQCGTREPAVRRFLHTGHREHESSRAPHTPRGRGDEAGPADRQSAGHAAAG